MSKETKHALWKEQCSLADHIMNRTDISIVTCPSCGYVSLHHYDNEEFTCPHCLKTSDASDFPDLFIDRDINDFTDDKPPHN